MADDLAYHPDDCTCATHASIRRFVFDHEPVAPLGIPAHRVNTYVRRITADGGGHDDNHNGPNLGAEFDTHGAGSMYRAEGMWVWDGIGARQNRKP